MSVENKVPEIRFKGFSGEWMYKNLQDLTNKGFSNGIFNDPQKVGKGYRLINVKDMYSGNSININNLSLVDIDEKEFQNNKVEYGDIFFTRSSLVREGIAYSNVNLSDRNDITFDGHLIRMQPCKTTTDPVFLAYLFKTSAARKQFILGGKTTTMTTIGQSDIAVVELAQPDKLEQIQIGNYFQELDALISKHQQQHDKFINIKKAMLEKMFPKQGETIPEIRFKGFSGKWEEISLLDSIERIIDFRGRTPKKLGLDWSPSGYRALSALNVKQGYIDFSIDPHFGDQELYDKWMSGAELHQGQVLFTTEAPMGNVAQVPNTDKYILSQRTIAFITKSEIIAEDFLAVLLRSPKIFRELSALSSGGTAKGVSQKVLANLNVSISTDLVEQATIGNYFQKLDALINQHQQQITKLNNIKQACLSKMFV